MNEEELLANNIEILTIGNINKQNLNTCMIYGISGNCGKKCPKFKDKTCEEYLTTLENEYISDEKEIERLNNIIDELEKHIEEKLKTTTMHIYTINAFDEVLNKLKELKGDK